LKGFSFPGELLQIIPICPAALLNNHILDAQILVSTEVWWVRVTEGSAGSETVLWGMLDTSLFLASL